MLTELGIGRGGGAGQKSGRTGGGARCGGRGCGRCGGAPVLWTPREASGSICEAGEGVREVQWSPEMMDCGGARTHRRGDRGGTAREMEPGSGRAGRGM